MVADGEDDRGATLVVGPATLGMARPRAGRDRVGKPRDLDPGLARERGRRP